MAANSLAALLVQESGSSRVKSKTKTWPWIVTGDTGGGATIFVGS